MKKLLELEQRIGYKFENIDLLVKAMTHSSYANEHRYEKKENNERLEFLGDAVLELIYRRKKKRFHCFRCYGGINRCNLSGRWFC